MQNKEKRDVDSREILELDVDRYVNEGLSGGRVDPHSGGLIEEALPEPKQNRADKNNR